jgi:hypothetical protein
MAAMSPPETPDAATCDHLLAALAELVAVAGPQPLLLPPVVADGVAFPDPWAATTAGVELLLRRLLWHAGLDLAIAVDDHRAGAPPTERKPSTVVELVAVRGKTAELELHFIGDDYIAGTLAHEVGVAFAALHREPAGDAYRTAVAPEVEIVPELDHERGSIATVYLGLGVLAVNAARQRHSVLERASFHPLFVAPVSVDVEAGYVDMEALAYLVAVQAIVRGDREPPVGLDGAQRRAVAEWMDALRGQAGELRERLGIPVDAQPGERPTAIAFAGGTLREDEPQRAVAFRWRTHRGGVGFVAGTVLSVGLGLATAASSRVALPLFAFGGAALGHVLGRRVRVLRCSACATPCAAAATRCHRCGASLCGDINSLAERLEAEERLESRALE